MTLTLESKGVHFESLTLTASTKMRGADVGQEFAGVQVGSHVDGDMEGSFTSVLCRHRIMAEGWHLSRYTKHILLIQ